MDAFFAAVEQRDFPEYRGKPLIVGGAPDSRGVVATCSYEARRFGIHSAMPSAHAYRLCPEAIFVRPRFEAYQEASNQIRTIFRAFTPQVEPLSLDEAYLDVTDIKCCEGSATLIAIEIKTRILAKTRLTASAGVSYNKFLAKIASDINKPDGLTLISPTQGPSFAADLEIGRFHGIGKATEKKMQGMEIYTGADIKKCPLKMLQAAFGKAGHYYYQIARGIDDRPVVNERKRKSLGTETTFQEDLSDPAIMLKHLEGLLHKVSERLSANALNAHTLTIKVKYADFQQITRSITLTRPLDNEEETRSLLSQLLGKTEVGKRRVRLLGTTLSSLVPVSTSPQSRQQELW